MKRVAFKMKLKPGKAEEYKKRHDEIWPELVELLKDSGISRYSIFLDEETNVLYGVQEAEDDSQTQLEKSPIMWRWWEYMMDIVHTDENGKPVSVSLDISYEISF